LIRHSTLRQLKEHWKRVCCMALLLGVTAAVWSQGKPTSLSDARAAIEANLRTPEGKTYDEKFGNEVMQRYIGGMRQCKQSAGVDPESFWLLLKVNENGSVREVLLDPATKVGSCAREVFLKGDFPPPPRGGYWQGLYLKIGP
jgi:hypothetical protein